MKLFLRTAVGALALAGPLLRADDPMDTISERLAFSGLGDQLRAKLSGTLDLEEYKTQEPDIGLLVSDNGAALFVPRLSAFLDAQLGRYVYVFAQERVDRGFDPGYEGSLGPRLDEYVVRITPSRSGRFSLQLGKFATVVGNWTPRHDSWSDPFITPPLPYDTLTGIWDAAAARSTSMLLKWAHVEPYPPAVADDDKQLRLPILWGPSYAAGAAVFGDLGLVQYSVEMKNASLSSRPESWSPAQTRWHYPTFSGRVGFRPDEAWDFGVSVSDGPYLRPFAAQTIPDGRGFGRYRETVIGQDASYAWHSLQVWAEIYEARYEIPAVAHADTMAYYVETKLQITPQFSGALRWNQQLYATVPTAAGPRAWGRDLWRIDAAPEFRFTAHLQLKLQASLEGGEPGSRDPVGMAASQLTLRW